MIIEKINIISDLFHNHSESFFSDLNNFYYQNDSSNLNIINDYCNSQEIPFNNEGDRSLVKIKTYLGLAVISFKEIDKYLDYNHIYSDFIIFDNYGNYCYYCFNEKVKYFREKGNNNFKLVCENYISYFTLYNFLISQSFADHHNDANNEIVFYTSTKGIFKILYNTLPNIIHDKNIGDLVSSFIESAESVQIRPFIKNSLFAVSNGTGTITITDIILLSKEIVDMSNRDLELALKQFDFDKFRDSLYKEKDKYFFSIREIISKIFNHAIGIPISISATVFATYKVSNDHIMLLIVLLSFILYVSFYIRIQYYYKSDILQIHDDFKNDFLIISSKSGLPIDIIKKEKNKIDRKINSSLTLISFLIYIVIGLGILVAWYILYSIFISDPVTILLKILKIIY
jgi:hypothetical protein